MKKLALLGTFCCTIAAAGSAVAADLGPFTKAPPAFAPPGPVLLWSGFYIGLNAGYTWTADDNVRLTGTDTGGGGLGSALAAGAIPRRATLGTDGFIGGAQIGYNWQAGSFVFGIETDIQGVLDGEDQFARTIAVPGLVPIRTSISRELSWLGTLRGRLGVTVMPSLLAYVTGGLAYGEHELSLRAFAPAAAPPLNSGARSREISLGWTIGGGVEYALVQNWSIKAEYLYYDLGDHDVTIRYNYGANTSTLTAHSDVNGHIVRAGLNYKF
jgi:outer membrane immunogenic protein